MTRPAQVIGILVVGAFLMGVSSCDWWPPTLQERIGQQDAQIKALQADKQQLAVQLYQEKKIAVKQICALMGISKPTLYAYVRQAQSAS